MRTEVLADPSGIGKCERCLALAYIIHPRPCGRKLCNDCYQSHICVPCAEEQQGSLRQPPDEAPGDLVHQKEEPREMPIENTINSKLPGVITPYVMGAFFAATLVMYTELRRTDLMQAIALERQQRVADVRSFEESKREMNEKLSRILAQVDAVYELVNGQPERKK